MPTKPLLVVSTSAVFGKLSQREALVPMQRDRPTHSTTYPELIATTFQVVSVAATPTTVFEHCVLQALLDAYWNLRNSAVTLPRLSLQISARLNLT